LRRGEGIKSRVERKGSLSCHPRESGDPCEYEIVSKSTVHKRINFGMYGAASADPLSNLGVQLAKVAFNQIYLNGKLDGIALHDITPNLPFNKQLPSSTHTLPIFYP